MCQFKHIPYLFLLATMSPAYAHPSNPQDPLIQPPNPQAASSRRTILRSSSNSISGSYPLYDLLSVSTQSGSISVDVSPHSASSQDPLQPATLELRSNSGRVHATLSEAFEDCQVHANGAADPPPPYSSALNADNEDRSGSNASPNNAPEQYRKDNTSPSLASQTESTSPR